MRRFLPRALVISLVMALSAAAAGQASQQLAKGPTKLRTPSATNRGSAVDAKKVKILMVTHAPGTEAFWVSVYTGMVQAGKDLGLDVTYRGTTADLTDPNGQRQLILNAIAQ